MKFKSKKLDLNLSTKDPQELEDVDKKKIRKFAKRMSKLYIKGECLGCGERGCLDRYDPEGFNIKKVRFKVPDSWPVWKCSACGWLSREVGEGDEFVAK